MSRHAGFALLAAGAAFLATGAGLIIYIASGISLLYTAAGMCVLAILLFAVAARRLEPERRRTLRRRMVVGAAAGFVATLAYDASRFALIEITGIRFWPFDIFNVFGQALLGDAGSDAVRRVAGVLFHLANGLGFAIAYTIWFGPRGPLAGIGFALGLELCMVSIYPGWLHLKALNDFIQVSVFGHLVYGVVLGLAARAGLRTS